METSESSSPGGAQGAPGTGLDSISSVLFFVTEFSTNAQLFGMAAQWIKEASQTLAEIQLIAVQHDLLIMALNQKQGIADTKIQANVAAIDVLRTRLDSLVNSLERLAKHNGLSY